MDRIFRFIFPIFNNRHFTKLFELEPTKKTTALDIFLKIFQKFLEFLRWPSQPEIRKKNRAVAFIFHDSIRSVTVPFYPVPIL